MKKIAKSLLELGAIKLRPNDPFTWSSGIKSPIYTDNRVIQSDLKVRHRVIKEMIHIINRNFPNVDFIVGIATGGITHATFIASYVNLPMAYVRPEPKNHGTQSQIEGKIPKSAKILVVEDLFSTGASAKKGVEALINEGYKVIGIIAVFSYELPILEKNLGAIVKYRVLTNVSELLEVAKEENYINNDEYGIIYKFWKRLQGDKNE